MLATLLVPMLCTGGILGLQDPESPVQRALERARVEFEQGRELWPDHRDWSDPWQVTTGHYRVTTTRGFRFARSAGEALEQMLGFYVDLLGRAPGEGVVFPVQIHPDLPSYNAVGNTLQDNAASYHSSNYGSVVPLELPDRPLVTYDIRSPEYLHRFLTHGAVHQYLAECFPGVPRPLWIEEGLSSYFTMFWDGTYPDAHTQPFVNMVGDGRLPPLGQLINVTPEQITSDTYIQLAMLFHYLLSLREDTRTEWNEEGVVVRAPFRDFLRKVLSGQDVSNDPMRALLQNRLSEVDRDLRAYPFGKTGGGD